MRTTRPLRLQPSSKLTRSNRSRHVMAAAVEFVPYTPIQKGEKYDLRLIQPHTVISTSYQRRDEGFLKLGSYMSGNNEAGCRCIETQPVIMTFKGEGFKTMQIYVVPREGDSVPAPNEASVELDAAGGELIASMRFEGNATKEACEQTRDRLLQSLKQGKLLFFRIVFRNSRYLSLMRNYVVWPF